MNTNEKQNPVARAIVANLARQYRRARRDARAPTLLAKEHMRGQVYAAWHAYQEASIALKRASKARVPTPVAPTITASYMIRVGETESRANEVEKALRIASRFAPLPPGRYALACAQLEQGQPASWSCESVSALIEPQEFVLLDGLWFHIVEHLPCPPFSIMDCVEQHLKANPNLDLLAVLDGGEALLGHRLDKGCKFL